MKIQVSLVTNEYRGDHAADIVVAIDCPDDLSVNTIAEKLLKDPSDKIEIRPRKEDRGRQS
jgi:hypothetical protein